MIFPQAFDILMVHADGEFGNVIIIGAPEIPGGTIMDKMNHINDVDGSLRRFVCFESRANVAMTVNLLLPSCRADAMPPSSCSNRTGRVRCQDRPASAWRRRCWKPGA